MAQNVYSVNVVGYVNVPLVQGYSLIANPLNAGDNSVSNLFNTLYNSGSGPIAGDNLFTWNGSGFIGDFLDQFGGGWSNPGLQLPPGVGFLYQHIANPGSATNTFVGTVFRGRPQTTSRSVTASSPHNGRFRTIWEIWSNLSRAITCSCGMAAGSSVSSTINSVVVGARSAPTTFLCCLA